MIQGDYKSDLKKIINQHTIDEAITIIETVSEEAQKTLKDFLYNNLYQSRENYGFIKTAEIDELFKYDILVEVDCKNSLFDPFGRNELNKFLTPFKIEGFKKNWKKEVLVEWVIATVPDIIPQIISNAVAVTINPQFHKVKRKAYSHLNQKFQEDVSWLWK